MKQAKSKGKKTPKEFIFKIKEKIKKYRENLNKKYVRFQNWFYGDKLYYNLLYFKHQIIN